MTSEPRFQSHLDVSTSKATAVNGVPPCHENPSSISRDQQVTAREQGFRDCGAFCNVYELGKVCQQSRK